MDPAPVALANCLEQITVPEITKLFRQIVRHVGPVITGTDVPKVRCTKEENVTFAEPENIVNLHKRRPNVSETFRAALPKSMYWIGTSLLLNQTISSMWETALRGEDIRAISVNVSNSVFGAAVRFAHLRYLAGQAVLAISVKEKAWAAREIRQVEVPGDQVPVLVRILRGTPGAFITESSILWTWSFNEIFAGLERQRMRPPRTDASTFGACSQTSASVRSCMMGMARDTCTNTIAH